MSNVTAITWILFFLATVLTLVTVVDQNIGLVGVYGTAAVVFGFAGFLQTIRDSK